MILDIDIWRCAALMIKQYGDNAAVEAAARADNPGEGRVGRRVGLGPHYRGDR